jgi:putative membrane protein
MRHDDRWVWAGLGVLLVAVVAGPLLMGGPMMGRGMLGGFAGPFGANAWLWGVGFGIMWLVRVAVWAALIGLAVLAVRRLGSPQAPQSAREILERRYAAGEISRQQYEEMRQVLVGGTQP